MTSYVIGIDIGTGSAKALAIDFHGKVFSSAQVHYPTLTPAAGYCEQAPEIVWQAFLKCINRLVSQVNAKPAAIVFSSAMHSIMAVDAHGTPLHNMIIWADNRSAKIARMIKNSASGELLYKETGTPVHAMSPLPKICWLKENNPSIFQSAYKFISIKEYIWYRLFSVFEVDHSIASAEGLMDIIKFTWSKNALETCGITVAHLSELVKTNHSRKNAASDVCEQIGIDTATIFIIGASDGCLANLGSFATTPGIAALTIGTSGAVRVASTEPVYNFGAMTFNYRLDDETFICGGPSNNGGVVLKWYAENFLETKLNDASDYETLLKTISDTPAGADGLIFLPYLFGERAPLWESNATGVFFGIKSNHRQSHFTRAVIEGISMALYDIADHMMNTGLSISQIHVSGGFVKSSGWLKILADIFNKKVSLIHTDDASALGAGYLGLRTLGVIKDYSSLKTETLQTYQPDPERAALYKRNFEVYRNLYKNLNGIMVS
jgi:gluconokinase